jgi:hypothetical protein
MPNKLYAAASAPQSRLEPGIESTVCGSYRRGNATCGDIDILLTPPAGQEEVSPNTLYRLLLALEHSGFLTDHLSLPTGYREYVQNSALAMHHKVKSTASAAGGFIGSPGPASVRSGRTSVTESSLALSKSSSSSHGGSGGLITAPDLATDNADSALNEKNQELEHHVSLSDDECSAGEFADHGDEDFGGKDYYSDDNHSGGTVGKGSIMAKKADGDSNRQHRLYFGSRGSYMGVCRVPVPGSLYRRIDIKVCMAGIVSVYYF